jgi:2-oxoglutarate ferredoxin oxidoreductase subunit beta
VPRIERIQQVERFRGLQVQELRVQEMRIRELGIGSWALRNCGFRSFTVAAAAGGRPSPAAPAPPPPSHDRRDRPVATMTDFKAQRPTWCPGCGDYAVLSALQRACVDLGLEPQNVVLVGGIGCSGKIAGYLGSYGFHGLHGRSLPVATGVKLANRNLTVVAAGGDGDGYGIGLGHLMHTMRRNPDITYLVMDNQVYGLTKGQQSPTARKGFQAKGTPPGGVVESPIRPLQLALASGCSFVAQCFSGNINHMTEVMERAIRHRGFSLVNVFSPCVTFNRVNTYDFYREHLVYLDQVGYSPESRGDAIAVCLEHGDLVAGVVWEEEQPTYGELVSGEAPPPATQDLVAERRWEKIIEEFA